MPALGNVTKELGFVGMKLDTTDDEDHSAAAGRDPYYVL